MRGGNSSKAIPVTHPRLLPRPRRTPGQLLKHLSCGTRVRIPIIAKVYFVVPKSLFNAVCQIRLEKSSEWPWKFSMDQLGKVYSRL